MGIYGIMTSPLLINNSTTQPIGQPSSFFVTMCPICTISFACNNFVVASCECTYHLFCLGIYMETKMNVCVGPKCKKVLSMDWLNNMGLNQRNMMLKRPKLDKFTPKGKRIAANHDVQPKDSTSYMLFYTFVFPISVLLHLNVAG
jgi:hypothetical protein